MQSDRPPGPVGGRAAGMRLGRGGQTRRLYALFPWAWACCAPSEREGFQIYILEGHIGKKGDVTGPRECTVPDGSRWGESPPGPSSVKNSEGRSARSCGVGLSASCPRTALSDSPWPGVCSSHRSPHSDPCLLEHLPKTTRSQLSAELCSRERERAGPGQARTRVPTGRLLRCSHEDDKGAKQNMNCRAVKQGTEWRGL